MSEHTPGPWHVERGERLIHTKAIVIHGPNYQQAGDLGPVAFATAPNARLIAAAPDLLAALQDLYDDWPGPDTETLAAETLAAATLAAATLAAARLALARPGGEPAREGEGL